MKTGLGKNGAAVGGREGYGAGVATGIAENLGNDETVPFSIVVVVVKHYAQKEKKKSIFMCT